MCTPLWEVLRFGLLKSINHKPMLYTLIHMPYILHPDTGALILMPYAHWAVCGGQLIFEPSGGSHHPPYGFRGYRALGSRVSALEVSNLDEAMVTHPSHST